MKPKRLKPRLPMEARDRLHKGGAHNNKVRYSRKEKHKHKGDVIHRLFSLTKSCTSYNLKFLTML